MGELQAFIKIAPYLRHPLVLAGFGLLLFFGIHRTLIKSGIIRPLSKRSSGKVLQAILRYGFVIALVVIVLGFALTFFQTYRATPPPVDVDAVVAQLVATHEQQLSDYREREEGYQDQIKALTEAVTALAEKRGQPDAPKGMDEALEQLAQGKTEAAEAIFQTVLRRKASEGAAANKEAAEAARYLGALAFLRDTKRALDAYRRATELDPDNAGGWNQLGHLLYRVGQLNEAEAAYRNVVNLGGLVSEPALQATGYGNLGIVYRIRGDLNQAEAMSRKGLEINEALGRKEGMASDYGNLGNVYRIRGDLNQAEAMYRKSLEIFKAIEAKAKIQALENLIKELNRSK